MRKDSAFQVAAELPLHIGRQRPAVIVTVAALDEPGREVLLDAALEHAPARAARLVLPKCVFPGLARGAGGHWQLGLGHAAEVRWLSTRRRRGIARRRSARRPVNVRLLENSMATPTGSCWPPSLAHSSNRAKELHTAQSGGGLR